MKFIITIALALGLILSPAEAANSPIIFGSGCAYNLMTNACILGTGNANTYTAGPQSLGTQVLSTQFPNEGITGTTLNKLAKFTGIGTVKISATTDTKGAVGVVVAGAGTSGSADIAQVGTPLCVFDGATTADDYVIISPTVAGDCHDSGATYPASGQVIGQVLTTNASAGTYAIMTIGAAVVAGGAGTGSVTRVTFTGDGIVDSSTPSTAVTTAGTVTATPIAQVQKTFLAGPTSGGNANPTFRVIAAADVPTLNQNTTGTATLATDTVSKTGTGSTYATSTSPVFVTPALGTPASGVATNLTGTAASLTCGTATATAAQTGTGTTYATNTSPTFVTPALGTPASGVMTNVTGTAASLTAGNATLAADLSATLSIAHGGTHVTTAGASGVPTVVALVDGATPALDASLGNVFTLSAAENPTIGVPSNPTSGQRIIIEFTASGGGRTLALNSGAGGFSFGTTITALSATTSGKTDYIGAVYNAGTSLWNVVSYAQGF